MSKLLELAEHVTVRYGYALFAASWHGGEVGAAGAVRLPEVVLLQRFGARRWRHVAERLQSMLLRGQYRTILGYENLYRF